MLKTYIGYSKDDAIRFQSSSGGITTSIIQYLLSNRYIRTVLGCTFNQETCRYELTLIHSFKNYEFTGSVYQEMDTIGYVKNNISKIKGRFLAVCAPCQVRAIKAICSKNGIECFIIDYFCSGQTTIEGTYCFYRFLGINKKNVIGIRYRGGGWPNGIEIKLKNQKVVNKPNYSDPWKSIHESGLFKPKRCNYCVLAESKDADVSVGDPWLKEFSEDKMGQTLFLVHTDCAIDVLMNMVHDGVIWMKEVDYSLFQESQKPNIDKILRVDRSLINFFLRINSYTLYYRWATKSLSNMHKHIKLMKYIKRVKSLSASKLKRMLMWGGKNIIVSKSSRWTGV